MKKVFSLLFCIMVVSNLYSQTWTGNTSTSWNISTNWSPAGVPTGISNVIIPGSIASNNWPVFAGNVTINSINMLSGSQLDINGYTLTLNGVNTNINFTGATLNNSNGATDIVINLNTGTGGYATHFSSNTVNDAIIINITGTNPFYEGDAAPANHYNGNVGFNINDVLPVYISNIASSQYNGNLTVNRAVAGGTNLFNAGGSITGNYSYTNNAGGSTIMGVTGAKTNISGNVNIAANYPAPAAFEMHRIVNQTTGGSINVQNSMGFYLEKDTLKVTTLSITGYRGIWYGYLWNNAITGNVTVADDASYTGGYYTTIRNNVITGNSNFSNNGTNAFYDADAASTGNNYTGNVTYNGAGTGPLYIAYGAALQCSGNLIINRTVAGETRAFNSGVSTIAGNFTYTNNTAGNTYFGNIAAKTSIGGTMNIATNYATPNFFEMHRLKNQTTGGTINVQNSQGFYLEGDTLKITTLSITGYRGNQYGDLWNNAITGNVTIADDASYAANYITRIRSNAITGNTSFSNNGTNQFFDADAASTGNKYIGNVTYNAAGGPVYIAYAAPLQCSGNLTINRTAAGITHAFSNGTSTIGGNFTFTNNITGDTYFGNAAANTSIAGTLNITANFTTPNPFEIHRLVNQTGGGNINVQKSIGFNVSNNNLIVNALSITGYHGGAYGYLLNNTITGNVTTADSSVYTNGYATYIQNNVITGNSIFSNKGTNTLYDAPYGATGNNYIGNVTFNGAGTGSLYIASADALQCSGNLTINRTVAGATSVFNTGASNVTGNFTFINNTAGNTSFGNLTTKTTIGGTVNITANYSSPNTFEMYRLRNQTGGGSIIVQNSIAFNVSYDTLIVNAISLTGYRGSAYAYFYYNAITGNVTTADDASYTGGYATYFRNNMITGNTSISNNGSNIFYDASFGSSGNKYIGNVTYTRTGGSITVAAGDFNEITQNLYLNSASGITLGNLKFNGNTNGIIEQLGTQPISIPTLVIGKTGGAKLTLNDSVTVTTTATFTSGNIYSSAGNNLIFPDNIGYTGGSAGSHVIGPVMKIGNDAFTFPTGSPTSLNTIAMSAPVETTSRFRAEYKNQNPGSDGYNTTSKAGSFGSAMISKAGYWNVQRLSGATNVTLKLGFATNPYEQYPVLANLKVAHWSGTQWDDHGNGGTTGTSASGTVINSVPITSFSPFALAGVINTQFYTYSNPGTGPDGTPVKFGGKGGYSPYSTKQLPGGSYTLDSIFLVANGSTASFKGKDFYGVEKDDTTITAPTAPTTYITANGNGTVNFKGWRHFVYMKNGSNDIMGAIKDNDLTLGNTTMYTYFSSSNVATSPNGNIYLKRSFKITSQFTPAGIRRIRFYISKTEFTNLQAADPTSFPNGINSLTITKYTGPQEDSLFNPIPGGNAVIIPNSAITIVDIGTMYSLDIDVPEFSGFYVGGNNSNLNICPGSTITLPSNISGATYQWQVNTGSGFTNLSNSAPYSGTGTSALTITNAPSIIYGNQYRCVVNGSTFSQTYTLRINVNWEGTVSTAWENTANWSCGALPDLNTDVIVKGAKPNYPQLNSNTNIRTMEMNSGATVTIKPGFTLQILEGLVIRSGATLDNTGTLILKKNLTNENASPNSLGAGTAEMSGSTTQSITGQNVFQNLTVNNATGVTIGGNTNVNGNLTMTSGKMTLGNNNLVLGPTSVIVGTPSASVMIIVTESGELRKELPVGFTGSFTYPVGDNTGTPEYSPVSLNVTSGTFTSGNYVGLRLKNEKHPDPNVTGNYLNRYWTLSQSGVTGLTCNATFAYLPSDVIGTESLLSCTEVNPLPWVTYALTNVTTHQLTAVGIVTFGSFTGVKTSSPPSNQNLANIDIPSGVTNCYDATQVLTVAGNGSTFLVENGGSVTLVAGSSILLMEGTRVYSGGYFHGLITTTGNYCGATSNPLVASQQNEDNVGIEPVTKPQFIKIYPNPTTDIVIVEMLEAGTNTTAIVTVYNMQGVRLLQKTIIGEPKFQFSLLGKPDGIYMVQVQSGEQSETAKVVKH